MDDNSTLPLMSDKPAVPPEAIPAEVRAESESRYWRRHLASKDPDVERLASYILDNIVKPELEKTPISGFPPHEADQAEAADLYLLGHIRWCQEWGWLVYDDTDGTFRRDHGETVVYQILKYLAEARYDLRGIPDTEKREVLRYAKTAKTERGITSVMYHLKYGKQVYCLAKDFDSDPYLLNCRGTTFNLINGETDISDPAYMHTKTAGFIPIPGETPRFITFLDEITCGDHDLARWLIRWMGYCLTEDVKAAYFTNFCGVGGNGKGVLLRLMLKIMGTYAVSLSSKAVVLQGRETEGRFEYTSLPGARLAVVDDVPPGRLAEGMIKTLTGEGTMRIEQKYLPSFEFQPKAKLIIASNHQLTIKDTGNSMRRRLRAVPFNYIPKEPDPGLEDALMKEAPAILTMLIPEAGEYLRKPGPAAFPLCPAIAAMSKEYLDSQDTVRLFIDDKTEAIPEQWTKASDLYTAYKNWAEINGYKPVNNNRFSEALNRCGIEKKRTPNGVRYEGMVLKLDNP